MINLQLIFGFEVFFNFKAAQKSEIEKEFAKKIAEYKPARQRSRIAEIKVWNKQIQGLNKQKQEQITKEQAFDELAGKPRWPLEKTNQHKKIVLNGQSYNVPIYQVKEYGFK